VHKHSANKYELDLHIGDRARRLKRQVYGITVKPVGYEIRMVQGGPFAVHPDNISCDGHTASDH